MTMAAGQKVRRRLWLTGLILLAGIIMSPVNGWGHGFGVHVAAGQGDSAHRQAGLSWDTAVADATLFNYRMNLGREKFRLDNSWGEKEKMSGTILENTFGFRLLANEQLRLWAGPQLVAGIYDGEIGAGAGLALGVNLHLMPRLSLGVTVGGRRSEYSGLLGGSDLESIGYLRIDLFFRLPGDRFQTPQQADTGQSR